MPETAGDWSLEFGLPVVREGLAKVIDNATPGLAERVMTNPAAFLELIAITELVSKEADTILKETVLAARKAGISWEQIGTELGLSRAEAMERFTANRAAVQAMQHSQVAQADMVAGATGALVVASTIPNGTRLVIGPVVNDMAFLDDVGKWGWHGIACDAESWTIEKSDQQWENKMTIRKKPPSPEWQQAGKWGVVTYWKRPLGTPSLVGEPANQQYIKARMGYIGKWALAPGNNPSGGIV